MTQDGQLRPLPEPAGVSSLSAPNSGFVALAGTALWAHKFGMSESAAIEHLRAQAERCLRLAQQCITPSASETLLALAAKYLEHANKLAQPAQPAVTQQQQQIQPKPDGEKNE